MASALSTLVLQKNESEKLKPFQNPSRGAGLWGKPKTKTENWFTRRDLADASPLPPFAGRWSFCPISGCVRRPLEGDARGGPPLATVLVSWLLCPQLRKNCCIAISEAMGHVWTAPAVQEESDI